MGFGRSHKNSSKQALNVEDPAAQQAAASQTSNNNHSGSASPQAPTQNYPPNINENDLRSTPQHYSQAQAYQQYIRQDQSQPYPAQNDLPDSDRRQYQTSDKPSLSRSQSTRHSVGSAHQQQQQQQLLQQQSSGSVDNLAHEPRKDNKKEQPLPPAPPAERNKKGTLRSLFSSKESKSTPPQAHHNHTSSLGRRYSKRAENPPSIRTPQPPPPPASEQQRFEYQTAQGSRTHLTPQREDAENDFDPYEIKPGQEDVHTAPPSAIHEHHPSHGIRPVQSESDQEDYDEERRGPAPPPHAHPLVQQQHSDASSLNNYQYQQHQQGHSQQNLHPGDIITTDQYRQPNPETVSQLSYDSPTIDQREDQQRAYHANGNSPLSYQAPRQDYTEGASPVQVTRPTSQSNNGTMPQSGASQPTSRREPRQQPSQGGAGQAESRDGPPPNYSRQAFPGNSGQQIPSSAHPSLPANNANYRGGPPQREASQITGGGDQGRSTPPPSATGERSVDDNYKDLLVKYKKVKGLYFDKTAQVEQLQNTLAIQRLSQSRTSLDDGEYMARFERLDRAVFQFAFNNRKEWRTLPPWLSPHCNQDAISTGKHEMTAVGRACITKFIVDEVFNKTFHPSLDPQLSHYLKAIERNIRSNAPQSNNQEEAEGLTSKIVNWRLATIEGLRDQLASADANDNKENFLKLTTTKLAATLLQHLQGEQLGIEPLVSPIIELAVSIACNMPLESRDIVIMHPLPGDVVQQSHMKVESGIPSLENPCEDNGDDSSNASGEKDEKEDRAEPTKLRKERSSKASSILGNLISPGSASGGAKKGGASDSVSGDGKSKLATGEERVRFAGFVSVEVRGRQMLVKAPVWTTS